MKIIFVIPDMPGGGTEKVVALLSNELVSRDIETDILLFAGNRVDYSLDKRIQIISIVGASKGKISVRMKRLIKMRKYFKQNKGAYIFSFSTIGTGFVVLSAFGLWKKLLVSERTDPMSCDHKGYRNFFYRFCDVLVCQSQEAANCFPYKIRKKAVIIPNPIDKNLPAVFQGQRKKTIVTAGRLERVKNHELLIRAFADFQSEYEEYSLHLYGKGSMEEELKKLSAEFGLESKVVFHGFTPQLHKEILDCGIFVLSSDYEGMSNSMMEAMALGIPVIATNCLPGGSKTVINDGCNGLIVPVKNRNELANAMKRLASDAKLSKKLSENGAMLREKYPIEKIADEILSAVSIQM